MPRVRPKDIPYGTCQCGCGGTTKIIDDHRPGRGLVKGEPYKLLRGHKVERPFIPPYATRVQAGEVWRLPVREIGGGHVFALVDADLWPGVGVHRWRLDRDGYPTRGVKAGEAQDGSCVRLHHLNYAGEQALRQKAMDIDWMSPYELTQAIPPAYTEHIGHYLIAAVNAPRELAA